MANKRGHPKAVLSPEVRRDLRDALTWSETKFGHDAKMRYEALIVQALRDIESEPDRHGSVERPEIMIEGARTYHIADGAHGMANSPAAGTAGMLSATHGLITDAGAWSGAFEKLFGVKSLAQAAHDDIKSIYDVDIPANSGTIKQVLEIATWQFSTQRADVHRVRGVARICATPEPVSRRRSQLTQTSRGTFRLSKRLSTSLLAELYNFWVTQNGGLTPFALYNPFDVAAGQQIGRNFDPTGNNTQGRLTVMFRGNWAEATDIARSNVQALELVEVA